MTAPLPFQPQTVIVAPAVTSETAQESMILSSTELADLCQEPLSDTGLARISHLISQMGVALNQTVTARQLEGDRAVA